MLPNTKSHLPSEGEVKDCVEKPSFDTDDTLQTPGISSEESLTVYVEVSGTSGLSQMPTDIHRRRWSYVWQQV